MRRLLIALAAVLLLAGCGSPYHPPGSAGGASVAPRSAALFVRVDSSFTSSQWQALRALGLPMLQTAELRRALGPETDLVGLAPTGTDQARLVALTRPPDPTELDTLLARQQQPLVSEPVDGWRAVARDRAAIDRLKQARSAGSLADSPDYREATAGLPAKALATAYVDGGALTQALARQTKLPLDGLPGLGRIGWIAGAASAAPHGIAFDLRVKADRIALSQFAATLPAQVPADVSLYVGFKGLDAVLDQLRRSPALSSALGANARLLGGLLDRIVPLFAGEGAVYARPGNEYTLVLKVADDLAAAETLDRLVTVAGALTQQVPQTVTIANVTAKELRLGAVTLYTAVFGGKLVVTTAENGIADLQTGPRLAGSQAWREATAAAAMPAETTGFLYVNAPHLAAAPQLSHVGPSLAWAAKGDFVLLVKGFVSLR